MSGMMVSASSALFSFIVMMSRNVIYVVAFGVWMVVSSRVLFMFVMVHVMAVVVALSWMECLLVVRL